MTAITQIDSLQKSIADGIVLDILLFFTTKHGTSESHTLEVIHERYSHIENIDVLIERMINLQLLVEQLNYDKSNLRNPAKQTGRLRLSHDTLAPVIRLEFEASNKSGQVARKLLEQKLLMRGEEDEMLLNKGELRIIRMGKSGMRVLSKEEQHLIFESQALLKKNTKRSWIIRTISLSVILTLGALWFYKNEALKEANLSLKATKLLNAAGDKLNNNLFDEAYILALAGHKLSNNKDSSIVLLKRASINYANRKSEDLKSNNNIKIIPGDDFEVSRDSQLIHTFFRSGEGSDNSSFLYQINKDSILQFPKMKEGRGRFSSKENLLLVLSIDSDSIHLYDINRKNKTVKLLKTLYGTSGKFSPESNYVLTMEDDMYDTQRKFHSFLYHKDSSLGATKTGRLKGRGGVFSSNEKYIITNHNPAPNSQLYHITDDNRLLDIGLMEGVRGTFTKGDKFIRLYSDLNKRKAYIYGIDLKKYEWSQTVVEPTPLENTFFVSKFGADESHFITFNQNGTIDSFNVKFGTYIHFSPNDQFALISKSEDESYLYQVEAKKKPILLRSISGRYSSFSKDNKYVLTKIDKQQYCINTINKDTPPTNVGCINSIKSEFFLNSSVVASYDNISDTHTFYSVLKKNNSLEEINRIKGARVRFSNDGKFAFSVLRGANHVLLHSLEDNMEIRIYHPNATRNISFIGKNGLLFSNADNKTVLLWPENPLSLSLDTLSQLFQINPELIKKLEHEHNFKL